MMVLYDIPACYTCTRANLNCVPLPRRMYDPIYHTVLKSVSLKICTFYLWFVTSRENILMPTVLIYF